MAKPRRSTTRAAATPAVKRPAKSAKVKPAASHHAGEDLPKRAKQGIVIAIMLALFVVVAAIEPHHRWRTFSDHVVEIARRSGCEIVATIGAMAAPVPHTRPFPVTGSAIDPRLASGLGLGAPSYQGPTGVVGALHDRLDRAGLPTIALRVSVPHYVLSTPSPRATRSLLRRIEQITRVPLHYAELDGEVEDWQRRVDGAISTDEDHARYVEQLERRVDSTEALLPSGEDLADELEAFLRDHTDDGGSDEPT